MGQLKDTQEKLKEIENFLWSLEGNILLASDIEKIIKMALDKEDLI